MGTEDRLHLKSCFCYVVPVLKIIVKAGSCVQISGANIKIPLNLNAYKKMIDGDSNID